MMLTTCAQSLRAQIAPHLAVRVALKGQPSCVQNAFEFEILSRRPCFTTSSTGRRPKPQKREINRGFVTLGPVTASFHCSLSSSSSFLLLPFGGRARHPHPHPARLVSSAGLPRRFRDIQPHPHRGRFVETFSHHHCGDHNGQGSHSEGRGRQLGCSCGVGNGTMWR